MSKVLRFLDENIESYSKLLHPYELKYLILSEKIFAEFFKVCQEQDLPFDQYKGIPIKVNRTRNPPTIAVNIK